MIYMYTWGAKWIGLLKNFPNHLLASRFARDSFPEDSDAVASQAASPGDPEAVQFTSDEDGFVLGLFLGQVGSFALYGLDEARQGIAAIGHGGTLLSRIEKFHNLYGRLDGDVQERAIGLQAHSLRMSPRTLRASCFLRRPGVMKVCSMARTTCSEMAWIRQICSEVKGLWGDALGFQSLKSCLDVRCGLASASCDTAELVQDIRDEWLVFHGKAPANNVMQVW